MSPAAPLLAHGGGAPEAAMIGVPLLLFVTFVVLERRARRRETDEVSRQENPDIPG